MLKLRGIADSLVSRIAPKVTADATWWTKSECRYQPNCSRGVLYTNQCWDSSFCTGWTNTGRCC